MKITPSIVAVLACSSALLNAASPIIEIDFNDASGTPSLANRGSATVTGSWTGATPPAYDSNYAPVNHAGWSGSFNGSWDNSVGGSSYADFGNVSGLNGLTSFTITGWINPASSQTNANARLVDYKQTLTQSSGIDVFLSGSGSNTYLSLGVDGTTVTSNTTSVTAGQWTFFAITYDGTQTVNNVSISLGNENGLGTAFIATINQGAVGVLAGQLLSIGGVEATADRNYSGLIDNIRIYGSTIGADGVLSLTDINTIRLSDDAPSSIPEPATWTLLTGITTMALTLKRRRNVSRQTH